MNVVIEHMVVRDFFLRRLSIHLLPGLRCYQIRLVLQYALNKYESHAFNLAD